mmetsp:Transcript_11456/g.16459  ORF Transcript_11456/g.16459 Transcript_11456/m.16459 type:complete len:226 (-) Transcript_11456:520-1197(-)
MDDSFRIALQLVFLTNWSPSSIDELTPREARSALAIAIVSSIISLASFRKLGSLTILSIVRVPPIAQLTELNGKFQQFFIHRPRITNLSSVNLTLVGFHSSTRAFNSSSSSSSGFEIAAIPPRSDPSSECSTKPGLSRLAPINAIPPYTAAHGRSLFSLVATSFSSSEIVRNNSTKSSSINPFIIANTRVFLRSKGFTSVGMHGKALLLRASTTQSTLPISSVVL